MKEFEKITDKLVDNTFYLFLHWLVVILSSFVFWVIVWKSLPPESAGIIATSLNLMVLISIFGSLGLYSTLTKLISEYKKSKQYDKIKSLINFSTKLLVLTNFIISIGFFLIITTFQIDLKIPFYALVLVSIGIFLIPLSSGTSSILFGLQKMKKIFHTEIFSQLVKLILSITLLIIGFEFLGPLIALVIFFFVFVLLRIDVLKLGIGVKKITNKNKIIIKYALPSFISSISWALYINSPILILTFFDSLTSSGIFSAAISLTNPLVYISGIMVGAVFPIISSLMVTKNRKLNQVHLINIIVKYFSLFSFPLLVIYIFFSKQIILLFARLEYLDAVSIIPIMAIIGIFQGIGYIFISSLFSIRKTKENRNITIIFSIFFLILSIPLTIFFGINGLLSSMIISLIFLISMGYYVLNKSLNFKLKLSLFYKILIGIIPLFSMLFIIEYIIPQSVFRTIISFIFGLIGIFIYFKILKIIKFFDEKDKIILKILSKKIKKSKLINIIFK